jgi:hypothetical protein
MAEGAPPIDPLARACELVGRFLYKFSRLEEELNSAIAVLFKLDEAGTEIITANVDLFRKISIVHSAVNEQNAGPDQTWLIKEIKETFASLAKINDERQIIAHNAFEPSDKGGVQKGVF